VRAGNWGGARRRGTRRPTCPVTLAMDEFMPHRPHDNPVHFEPELAASPKSLLHLSLETIARQLSSNLRDSLPKNHQTVQKEANDRAGMTRLRLVLIGIINTGKTTWISRVRACFPNHHIFLQDAVLGWLSSTMVQIPLTNGLFTLEILDVPGTQFYLHLDKLKNVVGLDGALIFHNQQFLTTFYPAMAAAEQLCKQGIPTVLVDYQLKSLYPLDPLIEREAHRARNQELARIGLEVTIPALATAHDLIEPLVIMVNALSSPISTPVAAQESANDELDTATLHSRASLDSMSSVQTFTYEALPSEEPGERECVKYGIPRNLGLQSAVEWLGFETWTDLESAYMSSLCTSSTADRATKKSWPDANQVSAMETLSFSSLSYFRPVCKG